jgi:hypothetical protein
MQTDQSRTTITLADGAGHTFSAGRGARKLAKRQAASQLLREGPTSPSIIVFGGLLAEHCAY